MADIFNTDNLYWVYTEYAKERLADLNANENLNLYKIRIGDYDWFTDAKRKLGRNGYSEAAFKAYYQDQGHTDLGHVITHENEDGDRNAPLEFFITGKKLSLDNESVILTATVDESYGGFDIREIGVYESVTDEDGSTELKLFAVCTMQPIPRPTMATNHYISSQINCHLCSQKLVTHFDKIEIERTNSYATKTELQDYQSNLLFVEANLAEQISRNSQLIGYNRVQQLYELMQRNQEYYAKFSLSSIYSNLSNVADVRNFWPFNYSDSISRKSMIKDLSLNNESLEADQLSTRYEKGFEGVASWLNFSNSHYYALDAPADVKVIIDGNNKNYYAPGRDDLIFINLTKDSSDKVTAVSDAPFTIFFVGAQNNNSDDNTIICKYNTFTERPGFSIVVTKDRKLVVTLYSNSNSYVTFSTSVGAIPKAGTFYTLIVDYNGDSINPQVSVTIDGSTARTFFHNEGPIYRGMTIEGILLPMFSFARTGEGDKKHINSKVCLLSLIKGNLTETYKQAMSYSLMSLIGKNPCLI